MDKVRGSHTTRYTHVSKNVLTGDDAELFDLASLAGITLDPSVFKIVVELIHMNVTPAAIEHMLKRMMQQQQQSKRSSFGSSESSSDGGKRHGSRLSKTAK